MRMFFIGDVVGSAGRKLVADFVPPFRLERGIDFVVANAENAAGGKGLTRQVADELFEAKVDVLTGGNHTWNRKEIFDIIDEDPRILRPANYPTDPPTPGRGAAIYPVAGAECTLGVVNLQGRVFLSPVECPFRVGMAEVNRLGRETPLILIDIHAEATSEKIALAWYFDGLATAVIGTHTHVATADETISPAGTARQTDAGMTGAHDSVLGVRKDLIIKQMLSGLPVRHEMAKGDPLLNGTLIEADPATGHALKIERIRLGR